MASKPVLTPLHSDILRFLQATPLVDLRRMSYRQMAEIVGCSHQGFINAVGRLYFEGYLVLAPEDKDGG